ncbi:aspartyl protease family protein [Novosphingobium sp.]|uniref:aspartyl protease family protein n=1 Tax=Novosphingobium sp. TaxID=1874826 RepID=UPI00333E1F1D
MPKHQPVVATILAALSCALMPACVSAQAVEASAATAPLTTPIPTPAPRAPLPAFIAGTAGVHDVVGAPHPPPAAEDDVINLARDRYNRMTVPVQIGVVTAPSETRTLGPFSFLIDTGAERTVIARTVATAAGLAPSGRGMLVGVAGLREVDMVTVDTITLGQRNLYGVVTPLLDAAAIGADGIIGLDGLQGQRVLLDFDGNRMAIGDARSLGGDRGYEIIVRARRKSGQLIMTDALIDGVRTDIVIDTGSDTSIGNAALERALLRDHQEATVQLMSVTGQNATANVGLAHALKLGDLTLNNTLIAFTDAPPFERLGLRKRPALLLGMAQLRLFHRVAIDFGTRRILFAIPETPSGL